MGRPEPCVLFSQTFVHPQLDEYVDEVTFAEPIVITACEFLEQNASSASQAVPLVGATSPPSFALEVFVQCEGETRFRRLCQPFLYSHSSSNVLEVEAVVTNHLVVRGSYRSLSLIIYGNTAEDLGQFNIEFDDNSLTNLVSSAEGKLDDLPLALRSANRTVAESLTSLNVLSLPVAASDIPLEVRQFLQLVAKLLELPNVDSLDEVVNTVVSAVCSYVLRDSPGETKNQKHLKMGTSIDAEELCAVVRDSIRELVQVHQRGLEDGSVEALAEWTFHESEADVATSKDLVEMLSQYICFDRSLTNSRNHRPLKTRDIILGLGLALLLCIGRESCFHFVNSGGMEQIAHVFSLEIGNSSAIMLLLLGVIEQATRHPIGCEGILGWWPREDENIPSDISKGYSQLLKLVLEKPSYDVASFTTYVLNRLRIYEIASRYENSVLSILGGLSAVGRVTTATADMLNNAKSQLKILLKLIHLRGPVEDPSLVACASRSLILGQTEGLLSYKSTSSLIGSSACCFSNWDVDCHLLSLLKERGFLPLSVALLSSPILRSEVGDSTDMFIDIGLTIGEMLLSLLMCRTGLMFLLHHPELSAMLVDALRGKNDIDREECVPLRHASILLSKGFLCSPQEIGLIVEMQLRVVNATDRLLTLTPHSEEFLWVLWELCAISRSDCGKQALLVIGYFPEAISILIEALHSVKEPESVFRNNGASPINLAIFHSAAEIFEVIVTDSTASSLGSWIGHAIGLHKALHSSTPGSNSKDAPTRLLEWIDAGVVYHKNGAVGLLRYSAVLASGGDAHINSTNILVSDFTDVEHVIGDASNGLEINVMDNLHKLVSEDGDPLRDSSIAQLTTAIRILAFISGNSTVAAALYDEGATAVVHAIVVKCSSMLEKSSNNLDYLVDEGTECNSTSDLLLERNREQSLVDLLVPSLVLLINLFHKLQEAKEQHRNTKLMNSLLRLHREVSPKLAACAADLSSSYPNSALGFGAVCHLLVSALACWPLYDWTPGLFHSLLSNVQATSLVALGPKETCSLFCLLNDLFPEEVVWLWDNGMPLLSALRTLAVGTLLGPVKEKQVNWYLEPVHREKLISQLSPYLDKIAQIIQHYAISELVVIQDMLRVFITRIKCQKPENASLLLRPILSCIRDQVADLHCQSGVDAYKVYRYLEFVASVLEHHSTKELLLKEGVVQILTEVLERCFAAIESDRKQILDGDSSANCGFSLISWCHPVFKSFSLLGSSQPSVAYSGRHDLHSSAMSTEDWSLILSHLLRFCEMLPVGKELLSCVESLKRLGSCDEGRSAFLISFQRIKNSTDEPQLAKVHENGVLEDCEYREYPSLLGCWKKLLKSIETNDHLSTCAIMAVSSLSEASLCLCFNSKSVNLNAVKAVKCLFGIHTDMERTSDSQENTSFIQEMVTVLGSRPTDDFLTNVAPDILYQATKNAKSLLSLLQKPISSITSDDIMCGKGTLLSPNDAHCSSKKNQMECILIGKTDDYLYQQGLGEKFLWECPETLPDRMPQSISGKRKLPSLEGGKRIKGDILMSETTGQSGFSRGSGPSSVALGPSRRDTFRQRKPNTSRPPSMHVDDYVARERNADGVTNSNVIAVQRVGSTGGRPPSIHVDEFMARQRERQNSTAAVVGEPSTLAKNAAPVNSSEEKINRSKPLKADLDDDLQGIDIVFEGEESESDDKLLFPQADDNLQQPAPVITEQRSPHSIVEETESDVNGSCQFPRSGTPVPSHVDETQSEISSRMSVLRPEMPLTREPSVSTDKKFFEQSDDVKNVTSECNSPAFDAVQATSTSGFPVQSPVDSRMSQTNFYMKNNSSQNATGPRGIYDRKIPLNQPPLPPIPPPSTVSTTMYQTLDVGPSPSSPFVNTPPELQAPHLAAFQVHSEYLSAFSNNSAQLVSSHPVPDSKYSRNSISSPGGSAGHHPPLPPTPPPFSSGPYNLPSLKASNSQSSAYTVGSHELPQASVPPLIDTRLGNLSASGSGPISSTPPPLMPPMVFSRTATIPVAFYGSTSGLPQVDNPNILQNISISQSSIQAIHQLQPLQPPLQRPPHPPQHLWQPTQSSQPQEQGVPSQQMQVHQLQLLQQSQISPMPAHYSAQQQELSQSRQQQQVKHKQPQGTQQQGDALQQQQDLGMSLQEYFKDPEAITSLLSNKEELCRLLEQHPKLMQMLQERLGQQ